VIHYVLDGYNVIYAVPECKRKLDQSLEAAREYLIHCCAGYTESRKDLSIFIVFDGKSDFWDMPIPGKNQVKVIFTQNNEKADDRILEMLRDTKFKGEVTVVSRDNYVYNHSRAFCAKVISPEEFFAGLTKKRDSVKSNAPGDSKSLPPGSAKEITEEYKRHLGIR